MGQDCCAQRQPQRSSLALIDRNSQRQSANLTKRLSAKKFSLDELIEDDSKAQKQKQYNSQYLHIGEKKVEDPPLFKKVISLANIEEEKQLIEQSSPIIKVPQTKTEVAQSNLKVQNVNEKNEINKQIVETPLPTIVKDEQVIEFSNKKQPIETLSKINQDVPKNLETKSQIKEEITQIPVVLNPPIEKKIIEPQQTQSNIRAAKSETINFQEKVSQPVQHNNVPLSHEVAVPLEQISFSTNFDTVQSQVSSIEQRIKYKMMPGKLNLRFLRALEQQILGKEFNQKEEEPIIQVIERPIPKNIRPRKNVQLVL